MGRALQKVLGLKVDKITFYLERVIKERVGLKEWIR